MNASTIGWVQERIVENKALKVIRHTPEGFLVIRSSKEDYTFLIAVLNMQNMIKLSDVAPLFGSANKPHLVVNVPSKTLWQGEAIDFIHAQSAAFGTLGDVSRAAESLDAGSYRNKNMSFFINGMKQHSNVVSVSYINNTVFNVNRRQGASLTVVVIDAYNMSAEDVRNARTRFGDFNIAVKSTSYGSITSQAEAAAESMGAQALTFADLLRRLAL